jgi:RNA polymerase sigma-70 factor (ECF subfamily)
MHPGDDCPDLSDCLRRSRAGDREASRQIVERIYPLVARVVCAYLPRGLNEEDWQQEVFLRMFLRLDQYRGEAPFSHWVARLAVNVCLDQLRQRRRRLEVRWTDLSAPEAALLRGALAAPDDAPAALAARELVDRLLAGLGADDQVVIRMLDLEKRPVAEIARLLGRGESWVKVRAFRARQKLRAALDRLLGEGPDG